ncbi:MAG: D-2-hydroxyacid dehydrogenase [Oscillospiraceae bacterium]|nr:D-2-hydroxyacid dehydrogenase [Oscillospiraceae bacterium]
MKRVIGIVSDLFDKELEYRDKFNFITERHGFEIISLNNIDKDEMNRIEDCEVIFGAVSPEMLKKAVSLKWFACSFAGVDKYVNDELYASDNVILTNSSGAYGVTIAESMIAGILVLLRGFDRHLENQKKQIWGQQIPVRSIYGSKITVIGMGDIGSCFAERAAALGAEVTGVRRGDMPKPEYIARQLNSSQLDDALCGADIVVLCVPATNETVHMIDSRRIGLMNSQTIIVNTGRGSAIDQDALVSALNEDRISGAFLDVTDPEPLPPSHPLWRSKNCIITPHVSGNTTLELTCRRIIEVFLENLVLYAENKPLLHVVNKILGY